MLLAHQFALESPLVKAVAVNAMDFPELADQYEVGGVPQTTINQGAGTVIGMVPESQLLAEMKRALQA